MKRCCVTHSAHFSTPSPVYEEGLNLRKVKLLNLFYSAWRGPASNTVLVSQVLQLCLKRPWLTYTSQFSNPPGSQEDLPHTEFSFLYSYSCVWRGLAWDRWHYSTYSPVSEEALYHTEPTFLNSFSCVWSGCASHTVLINQLGLLCLNTPCLRDSTQLFLLWMIRPCFKQISFLHSIYCVWRGPALHTVLNTQILLFCLKRPSLRYSSHFSILSPISEETLPITQV